MCFWEANVTEDIEYVRGEQGRPVRGRLCTWASPAVAQVSHVATVCPLCPEAAWMREEPGSWLTLTLG